jgi:hypothetical protein
VRVRHNTAIDLRTGQWETIALLKAKAYTKAADAVALRFGG